MQRVLRFAEDREEDTVSEWLPTPSDDSRALSKAEEDVLTISAAHEEDEPESEGGD